MKCQATERADLATALEGLAETDSLVDRLIERVRPFLPLQPPARVLDVGAAQGATVTAFNRRGFEAIGVEPWKAAIEVSRQVAAHTGIVTQIVEGIAESLPFADGSFEFVNAYSVMEHVDDPRQAFKEAHRVLVPGGGFYFATTSALSPRQAEIAWFPMFPWYPDRTRRAIMKWATERHPALVGHTTRPAYQWFKHREVRAGLREIGFAEVVDRWQLRREESHGVRGAVVRACSANRAIRLLGDIGLPGMDYLAIKAPATGPPARATRAC